MTIKEKIELFKDSSQCKENERIKNKTEKILELCEEYVKDRSHSSCYKLLCEFSDLLVVLSTFSANQKRKITIKKDFLEDFYDYLIDTGKKENTATTFCSYLRTIFKNENIHSSDEIKNKIDYLIEKYEGNVYVSAVKHYKNYLWWNENLGKSNANEEIKLNWERDSISSENRHNMYVVAYCFSEYGHEIFYPYLKQGEAFVTAAKKIGVKINTLKGCRDYFDGHNDSSRAGWWQVALPPKMQEFKDCYSCKTEDEIIEEAKKILK